MRTIHLTILSILISICATAQVPQVINYQAVARNSAGQIIPSQNVGVRFSVIDASANGTVIYSETHSTTTNRFGLFTLGIGTGAPTNGTFSTINWGTNDKFLKVEIAPEGGTNYTVQGVTQLFSVPYALYADKTNLIAGNNTVTTNGNVITGNYQAGAGINITGNVISSAANSLWIPDALGIHNQSGSVGIGTNSLASASLTILQQPSGGSTAALQLQSTDVWHTAMTIVNTSDGGSNNRYTFSVGGTSNGEVGYRNFGIINHNLLRFALVVGGSTNNIGIGMVNFAPTDVPRSRLHVFNGDVNIDQIGSGIIMKSPDGQCWRVTVSNTGSFVSTAIACP